MDAFTRNYVRELAEQLRINGVPEVKVRDIVAQVEGHAAATGDDLVSVFGQPVEYAARWRSLSHRRWLGQVLLSGAAAVGAVSGFRAIAADLPWTERVPVDPGDAIQVVVMFCILGLMPWTVGLLESRRRASSLGGAGRPSVWPLRVGAVMAFGGAVTVLSWLVETWLGATVLTEVPRWLLAVISVLGLAVAFVMGPAPNSAGWPVAAPWAPNEPWRTRVRRAFVNR